MISRWMLLILLAVTGLPAQAQQSPEERGLAIAQEMDRRDSGWGDYTAGMRMILRNRQGEESIRELRTRFLEVQDDGDKSLIIFDQPRDVQGTALLSHTHALQPDDQWLYLPALRRVKRIASNNKSGPFMGSEFAYEDLTSQEVEKYSYKFLREEEHNGRPVFVIERYPEYEHSGYTRQVVWIDQQIHQPLQTVYHDRRDAKLKTLTLHGYQQYADQYWRPDEMYMENHQTGKTTRLVWSDYQFGTGLTDRDFDKNSLKRAR
ncbi:outer membrane lipoprotein-sorting protein [Thiohalobacter thiocyanaticus]|uniref:Outer membrane lipoprotein-sorting protein n=1 Tax=Thiohalobacter thiocyanaticus TaxID=585455 RepID=A0A426QKZ2_9GAMM|nr:outer membrane lipoprotein-sorting protein [Thiohalobacter thiocyanaticus]RRQ22454.1 outer membrane lipoprotein-sorting protein [Thiohalobacter thiocyanaticus]